MPFCLDALPLSCSCHTWLEPPVRGQTSTSESFAREYTGLATDRGGCRLDGTNHAPTWPLLDLQPARDDTSLITSTRTIRTSAAVILRYTYLTSADLLPRVNGASVRTSRNDGDVRVRPTISELQARSIMLVKYHDTLKRL